MVSTISVTSRANGNTIYYDRYEADPTARGQSSTLTTSLAGAAGVLGGFGSRTAGDLPFTGLDAEHLMVAALLFVGLAGLVLADGRKRGRRFGLALNRIED